MSYAIVQNDLEPDMLLTLSVNGVAEDLSDIDDTQITMNWLKPDGTTTTKLLTAVSLSIGRVKAIWSDAVIGPPAVDSDTAVAGRHYAQVTVIRGNGEPQTFPNTQERFTWEVIPKIGG